MSSTVVVDTSIVIKWVIEEPDSLTALALLSEWFRRNVLIVAPALLLYEITNVLYQRVRKRNITAEEAEEILEYVAGVILHLDFSEAADLSKRATHLALLYGLPAAYDAHYLALAERRKCECWTADVRLLNALQGKLPWVHPLSDYHAS